MAQSTELYLATETLFRAFHYLQPRMQGGSLAPAQWGWVLVTGGLLSGYVATWYAALQRAPATAVTAVLTLGAPLTAGLQLVGNGQAPAPGVAIGYGLCLLGACAIGWLALRGDSRRRLSRQPA